MQPHVGGPSGKHEGEGRHATCGASGWHELSAMCGSCGTSQWGASGHRDAAMQGWPKWHTDECHGRHKQC
jgi:hypothetical protein